MHFFVHPVRGWKIVLRTLQNSNQLFIHPINIPKGVLHDRANTWIYIEVLLKQNMYIEL